MKFWALEKGGKLVTLFQMPLIYKTRKKAMEDCETGEKIIRVEIKEIK